MKFRLNRISTAVTLALISAAFSSHAADETASKEEVGKGKKLEQVVVTGFRTSLEASIATKRDADTNIEVVTADDIGKMPDKNVADALSRLSGVNITHGTAAAFDEAERVQLRGTPSNLNLVTINGHSISSGEWYVGDQGTGTRSVSIAILPSQLIGKAVVYKNARADITEGGLSGSVDVSTRKPLDFKKSFTGELAIGAVHSTLANKTDPQASALLAWKNDTGTVAAMVQMFNEKRSVRRDGAEDFNFTTLLAQDAANPAKCITANGQQLCGDANLKGKRMPSNLASALFEGERSRSGAFLSVQLKPTPDHELGFTAFDSKLVASNYNSNTFTFTNNMLNGGGMLTNTTVVGDVITAATIVPNPARITATSPGDIAAQSGHQARVGAGSTSAFTEMDLKIRANDRLRFDGRLGRTAGTGATQSSPGLLFRAFNKGWTYKLSPDAAADWSMTNLNLRDLTQGGWKLISDIQTVFDTKDQDDYALVNGSYDLNMGPLTKMSFGARFGNHTNSKDQIAGAWNFKTNGNGVPSQAEMDAQFPMSTWPVSNAGYYPANYADGISGSFPRDVLRLDRDAMVNVNSLINYDRVLNKDWGGSYIVNERTKAFYAMQDFEMGAISGNAGLRAVSTDVISTFYQALPANRVCAALAVSCPALDATKPPVANPIRSSRRSGYMQQEVSTRNDVLLPSLNSIFQSRYEPEMIGG